MYINIYKHHKKDFCCDYLMDFLVENMYKTLDRTLIKCIILAGEKYTNADPERMCGIRQIQSSLEKMKEKIKENK